MRDTYFPALLRLHSCGDFADTGAGRGRAQCKPSVKAFRDNDPIELLRTKFEVFQNGKFMDMDQFALT